MHRQVIVNMMACEWCIELCGLIFACGMNYCLVCSNVACFSVGIITMVGGFPYQTFCTQLLYLLL